MPDRNDVVVYHSEAHACINDGLRLYIKESDRFNPHNNMDNLRKGL
jgi:7-keto-8-aminopelargonate synthetase-like enzyme